MEISERQPVPSGHTPSTECWRVRENGGPGMVKAVLTPGDLAGVDLLAGLILIWRREVFHGMEREFRLEVICTRGKGHSYSVPLRTPVGGFPRAHRLACPGLGCQWLYPQTTIPFPIFTVSLGQGESGKIKSTDLPNTHPNVRPQLLKEAAKGSGRATGTAESPWPEPLELPGGLRWEGVGLASEVEQGLCPCGLTWVPEASGPCQWLRL